MNKYLKIFLKVTITICIGFLAYAAYDLYRFLGWDGVLNVIDFLIHGK